MATAAELLASLNALGDQLTKASAEIVAEIATLTAAVGTGGNTTPEVDASIARLQVLAKALDDLNPDVPPAIIVK
jgi:ABC-type transporter Mla subunit MlaD